MRRGLSFDQVGEQAEDLEKFQPDDLCSSVDETAIHFQQTVKILGISPDGLVPDEAIGGTMWHWARTFRRTKVGNAR